VLSDVAEAAGGWLYGLEHRLKTADAIGRKLAGLLRDSPDLTLDEALAALPDAVRYTVGLPDEAYRAGVATVRAELTARGYRAVRAVNGWGVPDRYPGIVTWWTEPASGQVFEVQLHTPASYAVRIGELASAYHLLLLTPDGPDQAALLDRLAAALAAVPVPDGATAIAG
jgi:hypothetical protein